MTEPEDRASTLEDEIFGSEPERDTRGPRIAWQPPGGLPGCRDLSISGAGAGTFVLVDLVVMWAPLMTGAAVNRLPQTLVLLLLAFGLGSLLVWHVRGAWRPYGFGLMAGWAFSTLISAGYLTGMNP